MANVLLNGANTAATNVALGTNTEKAMNFTFNTDYQFPTPKSGLFATVFPGDETWHPLCNHDYKEITQHLFGIESLKVTDQQKHALVSSVKDIVVESYYRVSIGRVYQTIMIITIIALLQIYLGSSSKFFTYLYITAGIFVIYKLIYANVWAQGEGESYWTTYYSDLNSKLQTGTLPVEILKQYGADEQREKDRDVMSRVGTNNSLNSSSFLSASLGGLIGGFMAR